MEQTEVNTKNWKSLIKPTKLDVQLSDDKSFAKITAEPLEKGYGLTLGNSWGKLCVMSSSKPDFLPKMPLSLKKIKPAIMANSMISIYSKL